MRPYREGVCVLVRDHGGGRMLVCHRRGFAVKSGWQFPQGGLKPGETVRQGAIRELGEEIGTANVRILLTSPQAFTYDFPPHLPHNPKKAYRGQRLWWVLAEFKSRRPRIRFGSRGEFDGFKWNTPSMVLREIVDFKKKCYRKGLASLGSEIGR